MKNRLVGFLILAAVNHSVFAENQATQVVKRQFEKVLMQDSIHLDADKDIYFEPFSPNTFELQLLQAKSKFETSQMIWGGSLQADLQQWNGDKFVTTPSYPGYDHGGQFYLTQATLDAMPNVNDWLTGFISLADGHIAQRKPTGNDIFLAHFFAIVGNIDKFPVYTTIGINTIPFGVFSGSGVWDTPLTGAYFSPSQSPQVSIGFFKSGLNLSATGFSDESNHENNFAYNIYYNKVIKDFNVSVGGGYLTDLKTNAVGNHITQHAHKRLVAANMDMGFIYDVNASIGYKKIQISFEYNRGSKTMVGNFFKPEAASLSASYTRAIGGKDTTFGIAHSKTYHLKNVPGSLPGADAVLLASAGLQDAWAVSASRSFFAKNISLGLSLEENQSYTKERTYVGTLEMFAYL